MLNKAERKIANIFQYLLIWLIGGSIYYMIEILWRGYSHPSMFIVGGLCLIVVGLINEFYYTYDTYFEIQILLGDLFVLIIEFASGLIVNVLLGWNVWDYSNEPFNIMGQICLTFAFLWIPVIVVAILLDDWIRYKWFKEEKPKYRFWIKEKIFKK